MAQPTDPGAGDAWPGLPLPKGGDAVGQPLLPGFDRVVGLLGHTALGDGPCRPASYRHMCRATVASRRSRATCSAGMHEAAERHELERRPRRGVSAHRSAPLHVDEGDLAYPPEVRVVVDADDPAAYRDAARCSTTTPRSSRCSTSSGSSAAKTAAHVLTLVRALDAPIVTTFHTVLPQPDRRPAHGRRTTGSSDHPPSSCSRSAAGRRWSRRYGIPHGRRRGHPAWRARPAVHRPGAGEGPVRTWPDGPSSSASACSARTSASSSSSRPWPGSSRPCRRRPSSSSAPRTPRCAGGMARPTGRCSRSASDSSTSRTTSDSSTPTSTRPI